MVEATGLWHRDDHFHGERCALGPQFEHAWVGLPEYRHRSGVHVANDHDDAAVMGSRQYGVLGVPAEMIRGGRVHYLVVEAHARPAGQGGDIDPRCRSVLWIPARIDAQVQARRGQQILNDPHASESYCADGAGARGR